MNIGIFKERTYMNLGISVLGLIITIMQLPNNRLLFVIKLLLTSCIASYVYKWWFGDYILWWDDSLWTQKNIDEYIHKNFLRAICCLWAVWFVYYFLISRFLKKTIIKSAIKMSKRQGFELIILNIKKRIPTIIDFTKKIVGKRKPEDIIDEYNDFTTSLSKDISFVIEVLTVWILIFGTSFMFIAVFIIVSLIAILFLLFTPITETTFKELTDNIKQHLNEENKLV